MRKSRLKLLSLCATAMIALSACAGSPTPAATIAQKAATIAATPTVAAAASTAPRATATTTAAQTGAGAVATATAVATAAAASARPASVDTSFSCDATAATTITLNGRSAAVEGPGATVSGGIVTIASAGAYSIRGSLTDGQIVVDTKDTGTVKLVLNGATIASSTSAPIYVKSAKETVIVLAEGSQNRVSDGSKYVLEDAASDEPNAAIFSKDDLAVCGAGSLTVEANYNDGIASKDGLVVTGGSITVKAADDGLRGKEYVIVKGGTITITAKGDGLKADEADDASMGYVLVEGGNLTVISGGDAIDAQTSVWITGGQFALTAGGGSRARIDATASAKGIKAIVNATIDGGTFKIDSADDAVNSNGSVVVNGGIFDIATGDDGMHANATLTINGGQIKVTESYEGIESAVITITNGTIHLTSSDDGLNVAGGVDGSGVKPGPGIRGGRPGQYSQSGNFWLYLKGGTIAVTANGDGVDVNGSVEMSGGVLLVNGPTANMNGALDYDRGFKITGGLVVATGSAGMAQAPDTTSTQRSILVNFSAAQKAGTLVSVRGSDGKVLVTFSPTKSFQSLAFSSPALANGATYDVYLGGSSTGTVTDSLYEGGTYTPGTKYGSLTTSAITTRLGGTYR